MALLALVGCDSKLQENSKELGFVAVALPGVLAYNAVDNALALGPTPQQPSKHPVSGAKLQHWAIGEYVDSLAWRDENTIALLTTETVEIWQTTDVPTLRARFAHAKGLETELDPLNAKTLLEPTIHSPARWDFLDLYGTNNEQVAPGTCQKAFISGDGGEVICIRGRLLDAYSAEAGNLLWEFSAAPDEPDGFFAVNRDSIAYGKTAFAPSGNVRADKLVAGSSAGDHRTLAFDPPGALYGLAFSPSGALLIVYAQHATYIVDADDGRIRSDISEELRSFFDKRFRVSRDDRFICGPSGEKLVLIDLGSGAREDFKTGENYQFTACSFSPASKRIAIAVASFPKQAEIDIYSLNTP